MEIYYKSMISEDIEVGVARAKAAIAGADYAFDHDDLDELMYNVLSSWADFGSEELRLSRGKLNAYFIQVMHLGMMGYDLGNVPEWNIEFADQRLHLFNNVDKWSYS